jgi:superfamily II DNA or RNA helicase
VGINLTQANVVFLMEPCFNPALEAQAVGRVWRLGQQRPVEIVRLQMKDSIEGRICKMLERKSSKSYENAEKQNCPNTLLGSLRTDKSSLMADEFDLLFGVVSLLPSSNDRCSPAENDDEESETDEDDDETNTSSSSDGKSNGDDGEEEDDDDSDILQSAIF